MQANVWDTIGWKAKPKKGGTVEMNPASAPAVSAEVLRAKLGSVVPMTSEE